MKKKDLLILILCYTLWGILPLYWRLLAGVDSLFVLCCRIVFSMAFTVLLLACTGRLAVLKKALRDKRIMLLLLPAALFITTNWGVYIWAVNAGHTLDASLGYYLNPLVVFALSIAFFKERPTKLQLAAMGVALLGVLLSIVMFGGFPVVALVLAFCFAAYGAIKKIAHVDAVAGIAIENLLMAPLALAFAFGFRQSALAAVAPVEWLLLLGGGVVTAVPMMLYSRSVNKVPFVTVGFAQYISPTLMVLCGLITGEKLTADKVIPLLFILTALVLYSIAMIQQTRAAEPAPPGKM